MTSCLTDLSLEDCQHRELDLNELDHLHRLKNLQALWISDSFNQTLTAGDVANYTPPSRYFKRLHYFRHFRTCHYDDDGYWTDYGDDGWGSDDVDEGADADH